MVARTLISIAKLGFLAQYYVLICLVVIKNLIKRVFKPKTGEKHSIFSHPRDHVHPDVFLDTRTFLIKEDDFIGHEEFTLNFYESPTEDGAYVSLWRIRHKET